MSDKLITADEARGLLAGVSATPWRVAPPDDPGAGEVQDADGRYVHAEGDADAAIFAAAPALARTVIALSDERDALREREAATDAWLAEIGHLSLAAAGVELAHLREREARLSRILACERGEWAPEGWTRNDFDPEAVGLAWYRSTDTGDNETPNHGDTVLWVYREPPSSLWTWEVERYDADGDNYDHVDRGDAPTAIEAIEAADAAAKGVERG